MQYHPPLNLGSYLGSLILSTSRLIYSHTIKALKPYKSIVTFLDS